MKLILLFSLSISAYGSSFEGDLKKIDALGERADSMLSSFGFNFQEPSAENSKKKSVVKGGSLFRIHGSLATESISPGALAYGTLLTRLVVGTEDSPALILIEGGANGWIQGLRIMGKARQSSTPGRIILDFDRLLLRNGKALPLQAVGLDESGALGLTADVFSGKALMLAGSMAGSFLSGYTASKQTTSTNAFGFTQSQPTSRNSLLQGVAQAAADQSKRLIEEATEEKPVLVVNPGAKISILFKEGVSL